MYENSKKVTDVQLDVSHTTNSNADRATLFKLDLLTPLQQVPSRWIKSNGNLEKTSKSMQDE